MPRIKSFSFSLTLFLISLILCFGTMANAQPTNDQNCKSIAKQMMNNDNKIQKIHEQMIGLEDAAHTFAYEGHYKILPAIHNWSSDPSRIGSGIRVDEGFMYTSDNNTEWMSVDELQKWIEVNRSKIGSI